MPDTSSVTLKKAGQQINIMVANLCSFDHGNITTMIPAELNNHACEKIVTVSIAQQSSQLPCGMHSGI